MRRRSVLPVGLLVAVLAGCASQSVKPVATVTAESTTTTVTATPPPTITVTAKPLPTVTVQQQAPAYQTCGYASYYPRPVVLANSVTSCAFAVNVADTYLLQTSGLSYNATVMAYSPTTGRAYVMSCSGFGDRVSCRGGSNAEVVLVFG
jgi:serine/threonine kinase PknH